ncbi:interferon-inducible GTPase 5-like isoform X2 [Eucyclogobius newberryi]|uniref:interferon-inducible GTPase 5-like isoform X2 n=1 Tax=Eucyclogobius newberryi TaxID=166745 RepID=UPI003B5CE4C1
MEQDGTEEIIFDKEFTEELQTALQNNEQGQAAQLALKRLEKLSSLPLNIAITGVSGSGKSTLVNALRGIKNKTEGAAPTGAVETTTEPTEYPHPQNPNIRISDLPGVGTTQFKADVYLQRVGFEKYDFFIIVSSDRFRENDAKLAQEIMKMNKKFYFVRSKIDHSVQDEREDDPNFNEEALLKTIRDNCIKELTDLGMESPKIFLVSGHKLHLYEFEALWKTLEKELPQHQRDMLLLALPNISLNIIKQKKETLGSQIKWFALASAVGAAVPVPGISEALDVSMILRFAIECVGSLGLTLESLQKLSEVSGVSLEELMAEIKSPLASQEKLTIGLILKVLSMSATHVTAAALEEGTRFIPFLGIPFAMGLSTFTTYKALNYILNALAVDAQRVFMKALRLDTVV